MQISTYMTLLGIHIGPGALDTVWELLCRNMIDRMRLIKSWCLGLSASIARYNALACSCAQYVCAVRDPPRSILRRKTYINKFLTHHASPSQLAVSQTAKPLAYGH